MKLLVLLAVMFFPALVLGQVPGDTVIVLDAAHVFGTRSQSDNVAGSRTTAIIPGVVGGSATKDLAEVLSKQSLVFIKSMGQGGLSTSSFRGTSSNHTQVNWNGININSPMLGDFDFSQVPAFFTDEITLFHGGGYLRNGTGALGGSINLNNIPVPDTDGNKVRILSEYGSNDTFTEALSFTSGSGKFVSRTRLYWQSSDNDFRYLNKISSVDPFHERRKNSEYSIGGGMQEFYYRINKKLTLSTNLWLLYSDRNLPQPVISFNRPDESQRTNMLRSVTTLTRKGGKSESKISFAYLRDHMKYDYMIGGIGDRHTRNTSDSYVVKEDYSIKLFSKVKLSGVLQYRHDRVDSDNYPEIKRRNTVSLQVGSRWDPTEKLTLNGNLMGEANGDIFMPTFSAGGEYVFVENRLKAGASVSYNYRAPTLNDLYWRPGGNPGLNPEKGFSYDATVSWTPSQGGVDFRFDASYYFMNISDWILWTPENGEGISHYWSPVNLRKVYSHGAELLVQASFITGGAYHDVTLNYGYSKSLNRSHGSSQTYNKQLPHIPVHKLNAVYGMRIKGFALSLAASYCGKRYLYTDNSQGKEGRVDGYTLFDAEAGYTFKLNRKGRTLAVKARANNIFDTYYESTKYFPMPLRSLFGSVILNL